MTSWIGLLSQSQREQTPWELGFACSAPGTAARLVLCQLQASVQGAPQELPGLGNSPDSKPRRGTHFSYICYACGTCTSCSFWMNVPPVPTSHPPLLEVHREAHKQLPGVHKPVAIWLKVSTRCNPESRRGFILTVSPLSPPR